MCIGLRVRDCGGGRGRDLREQLSEWLADRLGEGEVGAGSEISGWRVGGGDDVARDATSGVGYSD